ncbi:MAG: alcohol dehydrogenase [Bacteriovoracaceae bacterium]|nr:alcohol dehydrogenase [Bacteriovoracaceae bacterium]
MKAVYFQKTGSISNLEWGDFPKREKIKPGEVRLKFLAGSLNHLDLWVLKGLPRVRYTFPHLCGADLCGEVIESKSKKFKLKEKVLLYPGTSLGKDSLGRPCPENLCDDFKIRGENAPGVFAEEIVASDRYLIKAPKHLTSIEAASIPLVYLTAWQMIEKAELKPGKISTVPILVNGVGSGVSQALLNILNSFGAKRIAFTSRSEAKFGDWKKTPGFTGFTLSENTYDDLKSWAKPDGISVVFDHVGEALFETNIRLLKRGGKLVTCGATSGHKGNLDLRHLYFRQLQLLGSTMGSLKHFKDVIRWIEKKKIHPKISKTFPLQNIQEAYQYLESGSQTGKIVLTP